MGDARFLTKEFYHNSLHDSYHNELREELLEIDKEIGVYYSVPLRLRASEHWSRVAELPWAIEQAELIEDTRCIDVGSGFSPLPVYLARKANSVVSIDISPSDALRRVLRDEAICLEADFRDYRPSIKFDRVFCISVLEHVRGLNIYQAIDHFLSWLAPGGRLILTFDYRMPGGRFSFPVSDCVKIAKHYGIDLEEPAPSILISSSDFKEQGDFVGRDIGVMLMVLDYHGAA